MTVITYGKSTTLRLRTPRPSSVRATTAKPATRRPSQLPKGQTLKLAKQLRKEYRAYLAHKDAKPFGYERAQRHLDAIAELCRPHGRLVLALRGDYMPTSWAENLRQCAWKASLQLPVPGRNHALTSPNGVPRARSDGSTYRCAAVQLGAAIDDLLEFTRDRFHRM